MPKPIEEPIISKILNKMSKHFKQLEEFTPQYKECKQEHENLKKDYDKCKKYYQANNEESKEKREQQEKKYEECKEKYEQQKQEYDKYKELYNHYKKEFELSKKEYESWLKTPLTYDEINNLIPKYKDIIRILKSLHIDTGLFEEKITNTDKSCLISYCFSKEHNNHILEPEYGIVLDKVGIDSMTRTAIVQCLNIENIFKDISEDGDLDNVLNNVKMAIDCLNHAIENKELKSKIECLMTAKAKYEILASKKLIKKSLEDEPLDADNTKLLQNLPDTLRNATISCINVAPNCARFSDIYKKTGKFEFVKGAIRQHCQNINAITDSIKDSDHKEWLSNATCTYLECLQNLEK